jgi:hypothetical protein
MYEIKWSKLFGNVVAGIRIIRDGQRNERCFDKKAFEVRNGKVFGVVAVLPLRDKISRPLSRLSTMQEFGNTAIFRRLSASAQMYLHHARLSKWRVLALSEMLRIQRRNTRFGEVFGANSFVQDD